jgi:hypothetical protein
MNPFTTLIFGELHHFYLVEGDTNTSYEFLLEFLKEKNIKRQNIALDEEYEAINMETIPTIKLYQSQKSSNEGKKIIIIRSKTINHEAEHALLKMCEEPTPDTFIFILLPSLSAVRGTLRSRAHIINMPSEIGEADKLAVNFLKCSLSDRMDMITEIIGEHKDAETSAPLRNSARELVDAITKLAHKTYKFPYSKFDQEKLNNLISAHKLLSTSGAAVKMILEHLALVL